MAVETCMDGKRAVSIRHVNNVLIQPHYRFNKRGITSIDNKTRADKNSYRKVQVNELAEAINEVIPTMKKNKGEFFPKAHSR